MKKENEKSSSFETTSVFLVLACLGLGLALIVTVHHLNSQLDAKALLHAQAVQQLNQVKEQTKAKEKLSAKSVEELKQLREQLSDAELKSSSVTKELEDAKKNLKERETVLAEALEKIGGLKRDAVRLLEENEENTKIITNFEGVKNQLAADIEFYKTKFDESVLSMEEMRSSQEQQSTLLHQTQLQLQQLGAEAEQLNEIQQKQRENTEQLNAIIAEKDQKITSLKDLIDDSNSAISHLQGVENQLFELQGNLQTLEGKLVVTERERDEELARANQLLNELQELRSRMQT